MRDILRREAAAHGLPVSVFTALLIVVYACAALLAGLLVGGLIGAFL
jgi:hypothetical protein